MHTGLRRNAHLDSPVPVPHRLTICPQCGRRLMGDKSPNVCSDGVSYRKRLCSECGVVWTRQLPEEILEIDAFQSAG